MHECDIEFIQIKQNDREIPLQCEYLITMSKVPGIYDLFHFLTPDVFNKLIHLYDVYLFIICLSQYAVDISLMR